MTREELICSKLGREMFDKWDWGPEDFDFLFWFSTNYQQSLTADGRAGGPRAKDLVRELMTKFEGSEDSVDIWNFENRTWQRSRLAITGDRIPEQCRDALYMAFLVPVSGTLFGNERREEQCMTDINFENLRELRTRINRITGRVRYFHGTEQTEFYITPRGDDFMAIEALAHLLPGGFYTDEQFAAAQRFIRFED